MSNDILADHGVAVHRVAAAFPMIRDEEWEMFKADIEEHGIRLPILWSADGSTLIDGRNRLTAWLELMHTVDSAPSIRLSEADDELAAIASYNLSRRELDKSQRACVAAKVLPEYEERARVRMRAGVADPSVNVHRGRATKECGDDYRVGESYVNRARRLMQGSLMDRDLFSQVESGGLTLHAAYEKRSKSVESNLRTDQIQQPVRELIHVPSEILAWFRESPLDTAEDTLERVLALMKERRNSVHGGSDPFSVSDAGQLSAIRAQEINDMRARRDA